MKKVLIITYYWPPSAGAGVQRWLKFVKYLQEFDVVPYVVTVDPAAASFPVTDKSLEHEVPAGVKIYKTSTSEPFGLYKKLFRKKDIPYGGFANQKKTSLAQKIALFIRGNLFIPDARKGWNDHAFGQAKKIIETEKIDVVITTSPPHSTQLVGLKLKEMYGLPWIADLRDPWTDIYYYKEMMHTAIARKIDEGYEREVLEKADRVIVVSESIKQTFERKSAKIAPAKIAVIPNGYDEEDFKERKETAQDTFTITYTGTISDTYNCSGFMEMMPEVLKKYPGLPFRLRFAGTMPPALKQKLENAFGDKLQLYGYVGHSEAIALLHSSSALLLVIPDARDNKGILTGKLFEYLASAKPIIGIGPEDGNAAQIIEECQAGKMFDPANKNALGEWLDSLVRNWQKKRNIDVEARGYKKYSRRELTRRLSELIHEL